MENPTKAFILRILEERDEAIDLLHEAYLQIEYFETHFQKTGTGQNVLSKLSTYLKENGRI